MATIDRLFMPKMAKKPYPMFGCSYLQSPYKGVAPPPAPTETIAHKLLQASIFADSFDFYYLFTVHVKVAIVILYGNYDLPKDIATLYLSHYRIVQRTS